MTIFDRLTRFVNDVFKTTVDIFLEALRMSPNAQGYVSGSITELLLKGELEKKYHLEVKRIREKWEGIKHPQHHGDFYFCDSSAGKWFVMESKGVKSNAEKWHKLYNYENLKAFLLQHADKIDWVNQNADKEQQITAWIGENLPRMLLDYSSTLYDFEEVLKYPVATPRRPTPKSQAIAALRDLSREEIANLIKERLQYVLSRVKVLETHFVSGTSKSSERTQATPRKDEFNVLSVDIFLRYSEHRFLFANPKQLDSSGSDANHLQQNYIMGFVFVENDGRLRLSVTDEWCENLSDILDTLDDGDAIRETDMQVDNRTVSVVEIDYYGGSVNEDE